MATDLSIYEGEDKTWTVTVKDSSGTAINITGYTFLFTIKRKRNDSDDNAIVKKTITSHLSPTEGKTQITVDSSDTNGLHGNFFYDYQWLDTTNKRKVVLKTADFEIEQRIGDSFT
jgi:hypothetical protein